MFENLSSKQLTRAAALKERIEALQSELDQILGSSSDQTSTSKTTAATAQGRGRGRKGPVSAEGIARIKAAQKARWAKYYKEKGITPKNAKTSTSAGTKPKRTMSPAARARIAAAAKKRWAKFRKEKGS